MKENVIIYLFLCSTVGALQNGLARTPPMGWTSSKIYKCDYDCDMYHDRCLYDSLFRKVADIMSSDGYLNVGYEYIIIGDCWMTDRDQVTNRLQPNSTRFPHGIKALADYIHSKGLKLGIYEDLGEYTCTGYPGMKNYLELDAKTFAEWDIDYVEVDGCNMTYADFNQNYIDFGRYLNATGRPIVYSCIWSYYLRKRHILPDYPQMVDTCNLWRDGYIIEDTYESMITIPERYGKRQEAFIDFLQPGSWIDLSPLIVGNWGVNVEQSKLQLALWAILSAPLLMSVDLERMKPQYRGILLNKEVIAINQDKLGIAGMLVETIREIHVWMKPVEPMVGKQHSFAVAFQNMQTYENFLRIPAEGIGLISKCGYTVRNLFQSPSDERRLKVMEQLHFLIPPMGVVLLKFSPICAPSGVYDYA